MKIWLADGTNYPGQDDLRGRQDRLAESLQEIYAGLGENQRLVLECKFFEAAFYHTDVPGWGTPDAQTLAAAAASARTPAWPSCWTSATTWRRRSRARSAPS